MHRSEDFERQVCLDCQIAFDLELERGFAADEEHPLCFECATRRGGVYDARLETWLKPPDMRGVLEASM